VWAVESAVQCRVSDRAAMLIRVVLGRSERDWMLCFEAQIRCK
jgi:hypothetical protein